MYFWLKPNQGGLYATEYIRNHYAEDEDGRPDHRRHGLIHAPNLGRWRKRGQRSQWNAALSYFLYKILNLKVYFYLFYKTEIIQSRYNIWS